METKCWFKWSHLFKEREKETEIDPRLTDVAEDSRVSRAEFEIFKTETYVNILTHLNIYLSLTV